MIVFTRLTGKTRQLLAVNPDLLVRVESVPDTMLVMLDGSQYYVRESLDEVVERVIEFRARVLAQATELSSRTLTAFEDSPSGPDSDDAVVVQLIRNEEN
ncbi:MAG: flagellar FlbD family protein [Ancrocorticia sp.]|jgi:flagellar protein FlbD|nr:flagellar FlbD family protein [Ancrocorticia sp.]MCI2178342.1 flagellar FlbD family protein [Ancrocorticia sp.]MCI2193148.1 flagellar FlbD family protein [Ancrocorticia sp.]MCI2198852.1 flagellar FlbD family protein [Ancrocorticia sp.]